VADITITIQAASDAIMTSTGFLQGTLLDDSDARKAFGLPAMKIIGFGADAKLQWPLAPREPRFDTVGPVFSKDPPYYGAAGSGDGNTKPNPTTTAFQLRCDQLSHEFTDSVVVNPIPAMDVRDESYEGSGTPGQLNQLVLAMGMRTETIKLSGMLVDRGPITAANPRRQTLLNIARMQHFKTARTGDKGWGGQHASPINPRSYLCLKIYDALSTPGYSIGKEPSGDSRQYRGMIKDLSFRMEGGRPDMWTWNMTFLVVSNEHTSSQHTRPAWLGDINRIRLVDDFDGSGDPVDENDTRGYIEIRVSRPLIIRKTDKTSKIEMEDNDIVRIMGTNSLPTINGEWRISGVNLGDRTFIMHRAGTGEASYGEKVFEDENENDFVDISNGRIRIKVIAEPDEVWTDGTDGTVEWTVDYSAQGSE